VTNDDQYIMHGLQEGKCRLKSRNSFMKRTKWITSNPKDERVERWTEKMGDETAWIMPTENLAPGYNNSWIVWRSLNRL
jgi:hypothetical protein